MEKALPIADPDEAAELAARYRRPLMSYFLRRARDRQDAEDLTQEVFLRILRRNETVPLENAEVYLFRIAGNLLRDRARRATTHKASEHASLDTAATAFADAGYLAPGLVEDRGPERVLISQDSLAEVLRALDELGDRTRDICHGRRRKPAQRQADPPASVPSEPDQLKVAGPHPPPFSLQKRTGRSGVLSRTPPLGVQEPSASGEGCLGEPVDGCAFGTLRD